MKPVVRFVITDVHMGLSHDGLNEVIRQYKKKNQLFAKTLQKEPGLILFVNKQRTKAKLYAEKGEVLGYLKMPGDRVIDADSIDLIPTTFGGSVAYSEAAKRGLKAMLDIDKASEKVSPISKTVLHAS